MISDNLKEYWRRKVSLQHMMTLSASTGFTTRRRFASMTILTQRNERSHVRQLRMVFYSQHLLIKHHPSLVSVRRFSGSLDDRDEENVDLNPVDPPAKNVGRIVGAWIFCRHGDRTPSRPLCPPHRQADEAYFWLTKLPYPSTAFAYKTYCACFPPLIDDPSGRFADVHRNPFGFVSHKGLMQMQNNGKLMRQRYDPESTNSDAFLRKWKIMAYSTNYLRTVLSLQSFLDGLLGTNLYQPTSTRDKMDFTSMRPKEWPIPDHNFIRTPYDDDAEYEAEGFGSDYEADPRDNVLRLHLTGKKKPATRPKVFVRVRDQSCDNLNAFDRNPDLMRDLVNDVMQSVSFQQQDATAAPLAARLANILPGLARKGRSDFSANTPSGINWVEAADHFVCRTSHRLELSMFTDFEHDEQTEQVLHAMTYKALGHLAWRFRQWYQNPQLLAAIAAPPLREIAQQLEHLVENSGDIRALQEPRNNFLTVYSCHDVTLLALLYALGAEFLAVEESAVWKEFWPDYASTIAIELVRLEGGNGLDGEKDARHVMRVLMNGRVVKSTDFLFQKFERDKWTEHEADDVVPPVNALGNGPHELLTTDDFWQIVTKLESQGEYDFALWPKMKDDVAMGDPLNGEPSATSTSKPAASLDFTG